MNDNDFVKVKQIREIVELIIKPIEQRLDQADRLRGFNYNLASFIVSIVALLISGAIAIILLIKLVI